MHFGTIRSISDKWWKDDMIIKNNTKINKNELISE